jgi:hypothetical protein
MKSNIKNYSVYSFAIMLFFAILTGCDNKTAKVENAEENLEQASQDLEIAKNEYEIEMNEYKDEISKKIATNDSNIKVLYKKQMKKGDAKLKLEIAKLEEANAELQQKMTEAKIDSKEKWDEFKAEFKKDMDGLGETLDNLVKKNN